MEICEISANLKFEHNIRNIRLFAVDQTAGIDVNILFGFFNLADKTKIYLIKRDVVYACNLSCIPFATINFFFFQTN